MNVVELYGHADCCLCRTALEALERLRDELGFVLVERDITADEVLHRAYFERVPVVALDGEELFDHRVDEPILRSRLAGVRETAAVADGTAPPPAADGLAGAGDPSLVRPGDDLESTR